MEEKKDITRILEEAGRRYKIEAADAENKEVIIDFFRTAYSDQFNAANYRNDKDILARWKWANIDNPCIEEGAFPAWVCRDNESGTVVGHLGTIPVSVSIKDGCHRAVWGRDMIVPTKWRKSGIASLLFNTVMERVKARSDLFLLAGLNDYAVSIYKRLGFIHMGFIPLYVKVIRIDNILRMKIGNDAMRKILVFLCEAFLKILDIPAVVRNKAPDQNISIKEIADFDGSFDELWERLSPLFPIVVRRNSKSLNWRFVNQPYWDYKIFKAEDGPSGELKGYIVLREGQSLGLRTGVISDIFASPDDAVAIASLVSFAVGYFTKTGNADLIRCDILNGDFERALRKNGFINISSKSHFMVGNINEKLDREFIIDRNNWFINYADCDLDLSVRP